MAEISAALVKELRDQTGAPMMDCKRALQETNGDMEAAVRVLREKGMAGAAKRSDRATPEGKVGYRLAEDAKRGTMVAVGCETCEELGILGVALDEAVARVVFEGPPDRSVSARSLRAPQAHCAWGQAPSIGRSNRCSCSV